MWCAAREGTSTTNDYRPAAGEKLDPHLYDQQGHCMRPSFISIDRTSLTHSHTHRPPMIYSLLAAEQAIYQALLYLSIWLAWFVLFLMITAYWLLLKKKCALPARNNVHVILFLEESNICGTQVYEISMAWWPSPGKRTNKLAWKALHRCMAEEGHSMTQGKGS